MTAETNEGQAAKRVVYYSTARLLPMENGDPLLRGDRVTLTGEPFGCAVAYIETGALVVAPDDEQPGYKAPRQPKPSATNTDQGA